MTENYDPTKDHYILHVQEDRAEAAKIAASLREVGAAAYRYAPHFEKYCGPRVTASLDEAAHRHLRALEAAIAAGTAESERRVFLSYASEHQEEAREFHLSLLGFGAHTAFDASDIFGIRDGESWIEWIFQRLSRCIAMAFFYSVETKMSTVTGFELGFFLERMKRQSVPLIFVLPRPIDDVEIFRSGGVPIIELYRMTASDAADRFIRLLVEHVKARSAELPTQT